MPECMMETSEWLCKLDETADWLAHKAAAE